jgi:hypothetical protein
VTCHEYRQEDAPDEPKCFFVRGFATPGGRTMWNSAYSMLLPCMKKRRLLDLKRPQSTWTICVVPCLTYIAVVMISIRASEHPSIPIPVKEFRVNLLRAPILSHAVNRCHHLDVNCCLPPLYNYRSISFSPHSRQ